MADRRGRRSLQEDICEMVAFNLDGGVCVARRVVEGVDPYGLSFYVVERGKTLRRGMRYIGGAEHTSTPTGILVLR